MSILLLKSIKNIGGFYNLKPLFKHTPFGVSAHLSKPLNFKDMILEVCSPNDATEVYTRLANDKSFPIGVLFDWRNI